MPRMSKKRKLEWSFFLNNCNRITYNPLMKMYLMSLKNNGILMLNDHISHTLQTITTFIRHQIGTVEQALKAFLELGLVEILTNGVYYMAGIQLLIGLSYTEGERKKRERMRFAAVELLPQTVVDIRTPIGKVNKCPSILELDIQLKIGRVRNRTNRPRPFGQIQKCGLIP